MLNYTHLVEIEHVDMRSISTYTIVAADDDTAAVVARRIAAVSPKHRLVEVRRAGWGQLALTLTIDARRLREMADACEMRAAESDDWTFALRERSLAGYYRLAAEARS